MEKPYIKSDSTTCISACSFGWSSDPIATIFRNNLGIGVNFMSGTLSYQQIKCEINNNRPMKIIVGKPRTPPATGTSYHSLVIIGYDDYGGIIHYIDPGSGYYSDSYFDITNYFCMGKWDYQYGYGSSCTYQLTSNPCPSHLTITNTIGSNASISASNSIECNSIIKNNSIVNFTAGSSILLNNGFGVGIGSIFTAETNPNPCP